MRKIAEWFSKNWIWLVVGFLAQGFAIRYAYLERGYKAFGGEYLVMPLVLILVVFAEQVIRDVKRIIGGEDE